VRVHLLLVVGEFDRPHVERDPEDEEGNVDVHLGETLRLTGPAGEVRRWLSEALLALDFHEDGP
jgi:hypothetical protein